MTAQEQKIVVYADTSYLTRMPAAERADWNRLLEHAKACVENLDIRPRLEIHISEIALREYRGKMVDKLLAKIEQTRTKMKALQEEWHINDVAQELDYPFPKDIDLFPQTDKINSEADRCIHELLNHGVKKIEIKEHHQNAVWDNYFDWKPPFNNSDVSEREDKKVREKRRTHIPDAWILEAAIDAKNLGHQMLCLCNDRNLFTALESYKHKRYKSAKDILDILFPSLPVSALTTKSSITDVQLNNQTPLDLFLSKSISETVREIYLSLLGYVVPLDTPTHDHLIDAVAANGFNRKLTEACAVLLSDNSHSYIKDTGSHYLVGNRDICTAASNKLTQEIIDMLEQG